MTEKRYRIIEFLKQQASPLTLKEIGAGLGEKWAPYNYARYCVLQLVAEGKVVEVKLPCQPTRYQWKGGSQ